MEHGKQTEDKHKQLHTGQAFTEGETETHAHRERQRDTATDRLFDSAIEEEVGILPWL